MAKAEITVHIADLPIVNAKLAELDRIAAALRDEQPFPPTEVGDAIHNLRDRLAAATELLRRVVMDYAPECDPWFPPCTCSAWAAREFLAHTDRVTAGHADNATSEEQQ
jgi:hypothetical protein